MDLNKEKNIILFVNKISEETINDIRDYSKKRKQDLKIAVITDTKNVSAKKENKDLDIDIELSCDLTSDIKIMRTLLPYQEELLAITCKGDGNIPDFSKLIPHVPYLKTPTQKSLDWSIEKIMMRKRFSLYNKKITPKYCVVTDYSKKTLDGIKERIGFPLVVKPSNLASSLMISICFYEEELQQTLKIAFKKIKKIYKDNGRKKEPQLLVEQFMDGNMYSVDVYVNSRGKIYFCPLVKVKTGRQIGFDDFFGYQRITPTELNKTSIERAHIATREGVHALGLRSTSAHVELMRTEKGWKVIEIGPRLGGYRELMYKLSFGINHGLNDILIRVPQKPIIPKKTRGHTAVLQFFADKEGKLKSLKGVKKVRELESCFSLKVNKKVGNVCKYAKNGGRCVCDLVMFNEDRSKLLADIRRAEKALKIEV